MSDTKVWMMLLEVRSPSQPYAITRRITRKEQPWMADGEVIEAGEVVYKYRGCTYGCIGSDGVAVCRVPGQNPFFEVPADALQEVM